MGVSLISGWFAPLLTTLTAGALMVATGWRTRRWRLTVLAVAAGAAAATAALRWWVDARHLVDPPLPVRTWVWPGIVILAVGLAVAGFPTGRLRHRLAGPVAVLLSVLLAAASLNVYFAYFPTVGSLVGRGTGHVLTVGDFRRDRAAPRRAAVLPPRGAVLEVDIPGVVSGFDARPAYVYLPPAWWGPERRSLPVLVLLAGAPGSTADWIRAGLADRTADEFAATHGGMGPLLVMADDNGGFRRDTECVDGPRGRVDTYLSVDVRQFVTGHFGVTGQGRMWGVAGDSEGGTCALVLALRHPSLFRVFGDFGGNRGPEVGGRAATLRRLYGGSEARAAAYDPQRLLARHRYRRSLSGWFEVGRSDGGLVPTNLDLAQRARRAGISTAFVAVPGAHTFWVWRAAFSRWLPWAWDQIEESSTAQPPTVR